MPAPSAPQPDLPALQIRVARRVAPGHLRRLVRSRFPELYAELMERDSPAGLVADLFLFAGNHGVLDLVVDALLQQWPGLRYEPPRFLALPSPRVIRCSALLLVLGPMQDIEPTREDLSVLAPYSSSSAHADRPPEVALPLSAPPPAPPVHKPPPRAPAPLTSLYQLQGVLRRAAAPCSRSIGGGLRLDLEVSSDDHGQWSRTSTDGFSRDLQSCLTRALERARSHRRDRFPSNDSARLVIVYPETST